MTSWHFCYAGYCCHVCLGGAVMAQTLKLNPNESIIPSDLNNEEITARLFAIDSLRQGIFPYSYAGGIPQNRKRKAVSHAMQLISDGYDGNKKRANWLVYLKAADILELVGL